MEALEGRPVRMDEGTGVTDADEGVNDGAWDGRDEEAARDTCAPEKGCGHTGLDISWDEGGAWHSRDAWGRDSGVVRAVQDEGDDTAEMRRSS